MITKAESLLANPVEGRKIDEHTEPYFAEYCEWWRNRGRRAWPPGTNCVFAFVGRVLGWENVGSVFGHEKYIPDSVGYDLLGYGSGRGHDNFYMREGTSKFCNDPRWLPLEVQAREKAGLL